MIKVITYGTYDMLHHGHINLLERAKKLGDYLIVGVTADGFDKVRGKINVQQSLMERIEAVRQTGIADEIIIEEYEGQKIDDIRRYDIDIFTVGSDWAGKFDYLNEYCSVVYLPRTEGISSSDIREQKRSLSLGLVGNTEFINKVNSESSFVNGIHVKGICTENINVMSESIKNLELVTDNYDELLSVVDAVYIREFPSKHYFYIKKALEMGKHVLCESPISLSAEQCEDLKKLAQSKDLILMEALKTAYSTAYLRLLLLVKSGKIGQVVSVDATCTSLRKTSDEYAWGCLCEWGPTALLPVFQILGINYRNLQFSARFHDTERRNESFVKADFIYDNSVASIKIGNGVKSEGELVISGTKGYIYVPAPWWKTDYFEIRYENPIDNQRYFYQLDGEGIRYELVAFAGNVQNKKKEANIDWDITKEVAKVIGGFNNGIPTFEIK